MNQKGLNKKEDNRDSLHLSHFKENRKSLFLLQGRNNALTTVSERAQLPDCITATAV